MLYAYYSKEATSTCMYICLWSSVQDLVYSNNAAVSQLLIRYRNSIIFTVLYLDERTALCSIRAAFCFSVNHCFYLVTQLVLIVMSYHALDFYIESLKHLMANWKHCTLKTKILTRKLKVLICRWINKQCLVKIQYHRAGHTLSILSNAFNF